MFEFELGDRLKCTITGFEGIAVSRIEYLNGCMRYELQPIKLAKDGGTQPVEWVDEQQVKVVKKVKKTRSEKVGGSRSRPKANLATKSF